MKIHLHHWYETDGARYTETLKETNYGKKIRQGAKLQCVVCGKTKMWWYVKIWEMKC